MALNEPYWNPYYDSWMRVTKEGVLERLESGIIIPESRPAGAIPDIKNTELAKELSTGKRWVATHEEDYDPEETNFDTKASLVKKLLDTYSEQGAEVGSDYEQALYSLSIFELRDADYKLRNVPFSKQTEYRDHINEYVSNRRDILFGENGTYPHKVGDFNASNIMSLMVGEDEVTPHMISVKHPKAGRVNLLLDGETNPQWRVFDGLSEEVDGTISIDDFRSDLLSKLDLAPYIEEIITELDNYNLPRQEDALLVDNIGTFNESFNDIAHVPLPDKSKEQQDKVEELADKLIGNDKLYFEVGLSDASPRNSFLKNPKVALSIFNDLGNSSVNSILTNVDMMFRHNYLSTGHTDVPNNTGTLFSVLSDRNVRGSVMSGVNPITGYQRPVNQSGELVPYAAMTSEERTAFRNHFDDLYDRPKAWLQHTKDGQEAFNGVLDSTKTEFEDAGGWDSFVKNTGTEISFFDPNKDAPGDPDSDDTEFEDSDYSMNPYTKLSDVIRYGAVTGARLKYTENGGALDIPLPELIKMLDTTPDAATGQTIRDMLNVTQLAAIDAIMENDDARLAFGIDDKEEGLARKFKKDTFNRLLGEPVIPKPDDWKRYAESGSDSLKMTVVGYGEINRDELYKQRSGGILQITAPDEDGNYQMQYIPTGEDTGVFIDLPSDFASTRTSFTGKNQYIMDLSTHLDQSVLDQFVKDGVLPKEYASSEDIKARDGAPEAPDFGGEECLLRAFILSNTLRSYQNMRGFDNEGGMYKYKLDPEDPWAALTKISDSDGNKLSILKVLYNELNKSDVLGTEEGQFVYVSDEAREKESEILAEGGEGGGDDGGKLPTAVSSDDEEPDNSNENLKNSQHLVELSDKLEQEANAQDNTVNGQKASASLKDKAMQLRKKGTAKGAVFIDEELNTDPRFQAYQEEQMNMQTSDILANAPLDVRVTAFRMRIQGLQGRLDEATNMGEAYDIARDWMRIGAVEYPDILSIDRDGASKFNKLQYKIGDAGVDWLETNREWVHHGDVLRGHEDHLNALQEKINYLDETFPNRRNQNPEEKEAVANLREKFVTEQENLRKQGIPEFGSQKHTKMLYNDPNRAHVDEDRNNTPIGEPNRLTTSLRGIKNSITGALAAGLTTWREMRLYGSNPITAGLHAAMSTIGEGTGIGADTIRGMDLSKPLELMPVGYEDSGLRSYFSIGIPGTKIGKRDTMYERQRKQAGRQGQPYRAPQTKTEEQEVALQHVQDTEGSRVIPTSTPTKTMTSTDPDPYSDPPEQQAPADTMQPQPEPTVEPTPEPTVTPTPTPAPKDGENVGRYNVRTKM